MPKLDRLQARTLHGAPFGYRCARNNHVAKYAKDDDGDDDDDDDEEEEEEELIGLAEEAAEVSEVVQPAA